MDLAWRRAPYIWVTAFLGRNWEKGGKKEWQINVGCLLDGMETEKQGKGRSQRGFQGRERLPGGGGVKEGRKAEGGTPKGRFDWWVERRKQGKRMSCDRKIRCSPQALGGSHLIQYDYHLIL